MDGCSRQNPAYRFAKGKASFRGLSYSRAALTSFVPSCPPPDREPQSVAAVHRVCERMFEPVIVCVLIPRFALAVAAGGREALAAGPLALAPELGREQLIGEGSAAAEAYGVHAGMRVGEALARCPT